MANHSPSASGRRLSELLGEQQEPFYLDLYLLEKGCCSPSFLDAAACSTCWPRAQSSGGGGRLLTRRPPPARSKKKPPRRRGVLRLLLSKLLTGATPAPKKKKKKKKKKRRPQQPASIEWRRADVYDEKKSTLGPSSNAVECHHAEVVVDEEPEEEDDEEETKKQLSPVSVLEQRLFEHSPPPHAQTQRAMFLFSELLEAACYAPSTLLHLLANAKQYSISASNNKFRVDDGGSDSDGAAASTPPTKTRRRARRRRRRRKKSGREHAGRGDDDGTAFERDLARVTAVVASEMMVAGGGGGARVRLEDVVAEREEVGADVAAAVMEALVEEAMAELMVMGMGEGRRR